MSLTLTSYTLATSPTSTISFFATGGTSPYAYSVVVGGVGGTINSSGLYTAPNAYGEDTVRVTDANGLKVDKIVSVGSALQLVCEIIRREMGLNNNQCYLWDQKFDIPTDYRIYIPVSVLRCKPFGNTNKWDDASLQSLNMHATLSVDILSRSIEALNRKEEVLLALNSDYSRQQQAANSFYVAQLSTEFVNLSQVDGAAIPYRFNISVGLQYFFTKVSNVPYYDTFAQPEIETEP